MRVRLLTCWLFCLVVANAAACGSEESAKSTASGGATGTGGSGGSGGSSCGASADAAMACVDQSRLQADVTFIAAPRPPKSGHWQAVQDLCASRFEQYGFEVERQKYATGVNVIGKRAGLSQPAEQVIVSAHYDHIADCPGADDNATGVAAVLETARVLEKAKLARTLVLACWDEEEDGLIGAKAYAARAKSQGDTIVGMTSLEMIGYKSDAPNTQSVPTGFDLLFADEYAKIEANDLRADFVAIVSIDSAAPLAKAFGARATAAGPPAVTLMLTQAQAASPLLSDLSRSDHAAFWQQGYPALMVTDTSNFRYAQYHCSAGEDVPSLLDFGFMTAVTRASVGAHLDVLGLL